jgi:hypothetical protein
MAKASDNAYPSILITEGTVPASPAAGKQRLYIDSTTHLPKVVNSSGTASNVGGGSALTVEEVDGSPTDAAVTKIVFPNGTLGIASHVATYTPTGGGGGGGTGARYPVQELAITASSAASQAGTLGTAPTNGNTLILCSENEGANNVSSITQTNVAWTKLAETPASTAAHAEIWKGVVSASAGTGITVAFSGTAFCGWFASEWTGLTGTLDQTANNTAANSLYLPVITPTNAAALVIAAAAASGFGSDFTQGSPVLIPFKGRTAGTPYGVMFGFPGTNTPTGYFANSHGVTLRCVIASIT